MDFTAEEIIFWAAVLLLVSIFGSKAAGKVGIPAILLFLLVGMLTGSDGPGGIPFDDPWVVQFLGVISLIYILFSGAFNTKKENIAPVFWSGVTLSTLGVLLTAVIVAIITSQIFHISLLGSLLLGSIISATDAAAVFSILRSRRMGLKRNLRPLLEFESGSNDPMSVILSVGIIEMITSPGLSWHRLIGSFFQQMLIGVLVGYAMGRLMVYVVNKVELEYEGLYPVLIMGLILFAYGAAFFTNGSGFLAVYIAGLIMGNNVIRHREILSNFYEGIAWLLQIVMFIVFGLQVFPSQLPPIIWAGILIAVITIFIARPIAVYLSLLFSKMSFKEKTMVSWVGLRGATPIILATFPILENVPKADIMFNVVFITVIASIVIQAPFIPLVAKWLGVDTHLHESAHSGETSHD